MFITSVPKFPPLMATLLRGTTLGHVTLHVAWGARSLICLDGPVFGPATTDKVLPKRRHGSHKAARECTENVPDAVYIELKKKGYKAEFGRCFHGAMAASPHPLVNPSRSTTALQSSSLATRLSRYTVTSRSGAAAEPLRSHVVMIK